MSNCFLLFVSQIQNNSTVDGIRYYITDAFGEGLYDSCKDVKFGSSNSRALEFLGAGAKNFKGRLLMQAYVYLYHFCTSSEI